MIFGCKCCREKDRHIKYLETQVERLMLRVGIPSEEEYREPQAPAAPSNTEAKDDVIRYGSEEE